MIRYLTIVILGFVVITACAPEAQTKQEPVSTPMVSALASLDEPATPLPGHATATPVEPVSKECDPGPTGASVQYEIKAVLDWRAHTVQVKQRVSYRNDSGQVQDRIVFNVEPNRMPGQFALRRILTTDDHRIENYELVDTRLTVFWMEPLAPGCANSLLLDYNLTIPAIQNGYAHGHLGYWGYSPRQVNLGMWLPMVAAFDGSWNWKTPVYHAVGEHFVLQMADFVVEIQVQGASDSVRVAGSGDITHLNNHTWRFELQGGRELTLSIAEEFRILSTVTATDVEVELFYFPDSSHNALDAPRHTLHTAADALTLYEEYYGPYPYPRMVVVQGDFPDGMEFSGLVFVSGDWFTLWQGVPNDWLTIITAHEIAHQWWYALVGNDQGNYPYLDEALATYSEYLFLERMYPEYMDWWWDFRVSAYSPSGYIDARVYEFTSVRGYVNAVYLQGARMMHSLRADLGDLAFFSWLRDYAQQMQGTLAKPPDLWGTLAQADYKLTGETRGLYLRQPDVLHRASELP